MLKRAFIATTAALVMSAAAAAADLPFKAAPARAPAPVGWNDFYVGATVGGVWSTDDITWAANPALFGIAFTPVLNASGTGAIDSSGVTVGGTVGINRQLSGSLVWGFETSNNSLPINAGATINHNHRVTEDLARVGLNLHLP